LYPIQLFVEEAVPASVKRQLNMRMAVLMPEAMLMALEAVLATADVNAIATFPSECVAVVVLVIERGGIRVVAAEVASRVESENLLSTEVPPIETADIFPANVTSTRSNSTWPMFVTITAREGVAAAFVC